MILAIWQIPATAGLAIAFAILGVVFAVLSELSPKVKLWWAVVFLGVSLLLRGFPPYYYFNGN